MGFWSNLYKELTGSANKSAKSQQSKKNHTKKNKTQQKKTQQKKKTTSSSSSGGRSSMQKSSSSQSASSARRNRTGSVAPVNSRGNERRSGAIRARENDVTKKISDVTKGTAKYFAQKTVRDVAEATTATSKRAAQRQGYGNRGKSGQLHAPTRRNDRQNDTQKKYAEKFRAQEAQNRAKAKEMVDSNYSSASYVKSGEKAVKKLKKAEQKTLNEAASRFSGEKRTILGHEVSNKDIVKGGIKLSKEMADYLVPYGATTKGALKAAEGLTKVGKAGKALTEAGEAGTKVLSKNGRALAKEAAERMAKGEDASKVLKDITKKVNKSDLKQNIKKEIIANAMQDATIGTTIDAIKGKQEGLEGKDFAKYMAQNAAMNAVIGAPVSAIAGRTGKAGRTALNKDIQKNINKSFAEVNKLTRAEGLEIIRLQAKKDAAGLTSAETKRLYELNKKAITNRSGIAQMNDKGKLVVNNDGVVKEVLSPSEVKDFARLQAKQASGTLKSNDIGRLVKLGQRVEGAYKAVQTNAKIAVSTAKAGGKVDLNAMDSAVNFYRRTRDTKQAKVAEDARTSTAMKQFNTDKTTAKFITSTVDRSNGNITIRPMDESTARKVFGLSDSQGFDGVTVNVNGKKVVLLNPNSKRGTAVTLGHELTHHVIEGDDKFIDIMKGYAGKDWEIQMEKTRKPYDDYMKKVERGEVNPDEQNFDVDINMDEETACDLMGRYISEKNFFRHLLDEDKGAFQKMRDYIKNIIKTDKEFADDAEFKALADRFEEAYRGDTAGEDGAKFALSQGKETLHGGKGSASEYLTENGFPEIKKLMSDAKDGDAKAAAELKKKTGWYSDNGKWQFDIDISNMSFKNGIGNLVKKGDAGGDLGEELGGVDTLFKNYPDLEYAAVKFGDIGDELYKLETGGKNLYGIVLNKDLTKNGSDLVKSLGVKKNVAVNDAMSDALQDVISKIDQGKLARADAENYAEELFDEEGLQKLTNQSQKPTLKNKQPKTSALNEKISKTVDNTKTYDSFVKQYSKEYDNMSDIERFELMEEYGFHLFGKDEDVGATIDRLSEDFKKVLIENGNTKPVKKTVNQFTDLMEDYDAVDYIMKDAKVSEDRASDYLYSVKEYTKSQNVMNIKTSGEERVNELIKYINEYVNKSSAYDLPEGESLYRGVAFGEVGDPKSDAMWESLKDLLEKKMKPGDVFDSSLHYKPGTNGVPSSWSIYENTSKGFAEWNDKTVYSVLAMQHNNITGTPVEHITEVPGEGEVLFGTIKQNTYLGHEFVSDRKVIIHTLERAANAPEPRAKFALTELSGNDESKLWGHGDHEKVGKNAAEEKATRPMDVKGVLDRSKRAPTADEMNQTAINMIKKDMEKYGGDKGFTKLIDEDLGKGMFGKYNKQSREAASANAKNELEELGYEDMLAKFLKSDFSEDPYVNAKRAVALRNEISRMIDAGEGDVRQLYADSAEIVSKMSSYSGFSSHVLNAMKEFATATPEGRIRTVRNEIARLEKRYANRIPGGKLEIDDAKLEELATAEGKRKEELLDEINRELWEQIPASIMERLNEYRHCFMLFNAKTHARNVFGNVVFRFARKISDEMEVAILNTGAARNRIGKLEGRKAEDVIIDKVHVTRKELNDNVGYLENEFRDIYDKSGSRNKYIEMGRPDGVPTVKFKPMQKLIDLNYNALEKEDLKGALKPAFNKAYIGYCKARCPEGEELRAFMEGMTDAQKEKARRYAMVQGEYATFRDSCAFSDWLIGKKQTFAGKEASTKWGTFGYRALDVVLEGTLPFVKTPVNVFRRSVDFSPASLVMSVGKLARARSADEFKLGVHQLCTGLTGTGMMGLGVYLSTQGLMTVKAGEESGDAYYDRDMGFQDYSLKIPIGGKEYSWTLDWMAPMGMSLFAGAAFQKMFDKEGFDNTAALNAFFACTSPLTDMSFMSSPKDTTERFLENATRGAGEKETDFAGALAQLILGDMPKNYVSGFFPQLMAQTAGFIDPVQRDTRSTRENVYLKGWESSARQIVNKVPGLRQLLLNPKVNRRGEDVVTGGNIVTRMVNAYLNPSNVKEINENETDRELIKIRNHIEDKDSNDYKYFYYNFTGNPSYSLANGKRMTYDEAYTYGKANRIEQNKCVKRMLDAPSYKSMTWKMKADEVDDGHWIGTAVADMKTYGANYAMKSMLKNNDKEAESVKEYKRISGKAGEEANKAYMNYYIDKERLLARSHATGDDVYRIKGITAIQKGDDALLQSLDIHKSKVTALKRYWKLVKKDSQNGKEAKMTMFNELSDGCCRIMSNTNRAEVSNPSKGVKSVSAGMVAVDGNQIAERVYRAFGYNWNSAQSGAGLMMKYNKDGKYSIEKITEMKSTLRNRFDTNNSGSVNKDEVVQYIDSLNIKSDDEKACLYEVLYGGGNYKNPYKAQVNDHLKWGENRDDEWSGDSSGGSGYGRRGRRRGGGGSGGSSKGTVIETTSGAVDGKVTNPFSSGSNGSSASNLNDAYRKRLKKLREQTRK